MTQLINNQQVEICELCRRVDYPPWSAKSSLWNKVVRDEEGRDQFGFLCLACFVEMAFSQNAATHFTLLPDYYAKERPDPETKAEYEFRIEELERQLDNAEWRLDNILR